MANISRFEMNLPSDKREQYEAAAKEEGLSLSGWMQLAADHALKGLPGELLIEALEAVIDDCGGVEKLSRRTFSLVKSALESVGRL